MKFLAAAVLVLAVGCSSPGYVDPDGIDGLVTAVCNRHDAYVRADAVAYSGSSGEARRASDLTSSDLLRKIVAKGKAAKHGGAAP